MHGELESVTAAHSPFRLFTAGFTKRNNAQVVSWTSDTFLGLTLFIPPLNCERPVFIFAPIKKKRANPTKGYV